MRAMVLDGAGIPLRYERGADLPRLERGRVLVRVTACGVCRTDLHIFDGDLAQPAVPLVLGHQVVGRIAATDLAARRFSVGERVGIPWLAWTDGVCGYCRSGRENLCDRARFTGYSVDGGYAEYTAADERYCLRLPEEYSDVDAAPLLCAGLIGYRALRFTEDAVNVGFYGFGASAHILAQVARHQGRRVFALTRPGDEKTQAYARSHGAAWTGGSDETPPEPLDAAIVFAPVGALIPAALAATRKGGIVVCAGIHMSEIPAFSYDLLWEERTLRSVANLTRSDAEEFLALAPRVPVRTAVTVLPLERANEALQRLREGDVPRGSLVLTI